MLLPEEADAIENLAGSGARRFEALFQLGVFHLQFFHALGADAHAARGRIDRLDSRLRLKRAATEARQLIAKMANELLKLVEGKRVRTFAV